MNKKRYGVYKDIEYYLRIKTNKYHYEYIISSNLINTFDNLDTAIKYANDYKLDIDKYENSIYVDTISIFEVGEDDEIISDNLYVNAPSYEELESMLDIKIVVY